VTFRNRETRVKEIQTNPITLSCRERETYVKGIQKNPISLVLRWREPKGELKRD
jgi:hypothetical protein